MGSTYRSTYFVVTEAIFIFQDYESDFEEDESGSGSEDEDSSPSEDASSSASSPTQDSSEESDVDMPDPEVAAVLQAIQEENNNFEIHLQRTFSIDIPDQEQKSLTPEKKPHTGMEKSQIISR